MSTPHSPNQSTYTSRLPTVIATRQQHQRSRSTHPTDGIFRVFSCPPPPESVYDSEKAAIRAVHAWTKDHSFDMTKRRAFFVDPPADTTVWSCLRPVQTACLWAHTLGWPRLLARCQSRSGLDGPRAPHLQHESTGTQKIAVPNQRRSTQ
jgi:hypothetical protein